MPLDFSSGGTALDFSGTGTPMFVSPPTNEAAKTNKPDFAKAGTLLDFSAGGKPVEQPGWLARQADKVWHWYRHLGDEDQARYAREYDILKTAKSPRDLLLKRNDPNNPDTRAAFDQLLGMAGDAGPGRVGEALAPKAAKNIPENIPGAARATEKPAGEPVAARAPEQPVVPEAPPAVKKPTSPSMPTEGPLSRPAAITKPRDFTEQLYALEGNKLADAADVKHALEAVPKGVKPETWEKLYHHEENPEGVKLSPDEAKLYADHVAPITQEADKLSRELEGLDWDVPEGMTRPEGSQGYTPRYVAGRTRSYGEALAQWEKGIEAKFGGAAGRSLRKTVDAQKSRRFWKAVNPESGDERVVHVGTDGNVLAFDGTPKPQAFGSFARGQKIGAGSKVRVGGEQWKLEPATTAEIEDVARVRYHKNVLANRLDNLAKLRSATRIAQFIDSMKSSPEWPSVAVKYDRNAIPPESNGRAWRTPKLLQFREWLVEPRLADALDDFARDMGTVEGFEQGLLKIGKAMNAVMFLNPKAHIDNVFNHMMVSRGLAGNIAQMPSTMRQLYRAMKEVTTAGPMYTRMLRSGLSLPYARYLSDDLHATLIAKLAAGAKTNPGMFRDLAAKFGYPDAKTMVKRLASVPNRALWIASDVMTLSRAMQLMEQGSLLRGARGIENAIRETHETMPSYRVPGEVLASRRLHELFANPAWGRFGRYQFNKLQIYADDLKKAFGPHHDMRERAEAFDRLAMLGVYTFLVYQYAFDPLYKWATGNKNAEATRAGASSVPQAMLDAYGGKRNIHDVASSVFTPGVPLELMGEMVTGRYGWSGQPIMRDADVRAGRWKTVANDALSYALSKLSTVGQMFSPQSRQSLGEEASRALGVKSPTDEELGRRQKGRNWDAREAAKRAARMEAQ